MKGLVTFYQAFLVEPDYGVNFVLKGRVYQFLGCVRAHCDTFVIASYCGGSRSYRIFPFSEYKNERIHFI